MPKYKYLCRECEHEFEVFHSMKERLEDCEQCNKESTLDRIPYLVNVTIKGEQAGAVVDKHIADAKRELSRDKELLKKKEYKNE